MGQPAHTPLKPLLARLAAIAVECGMYKRTDVVERVSDRGQRLDGARLVGGRACAAAQRIDHDLGLQQAAHRRPCRSLHRIRWHTFIGSQDGLGDGRHGGVPRVADDGEAPVPATHVQYPYGSIGACRRPSRTHELLASFMYAAAHGTAIAMIRTPSGQYGGLL
jgi:hypothetical protein